MVVTAESPEEVLQEVFLGIISTADALDVNEDDMIELERAG